MNPEKRHLGVYENNGTLGCSKEGVDSKFPQQNISKRDVRSSEGGAVLYWTGSKFQYNMGGLESKYFSYSRRVAL